MHCRGRAASGAPLLGPKKRGRLTIAFKDEAVRRRIQALIGELDPDAGAGPIGRRRGHEWRIREDLIEILVYDGRFPELDLPVQQQRDPWRAAQMNLISTPRGTNPRLRLLARRGRP